MSFIEISPNNISQNIFELIGKDWALVCAGDKTKYNMMTVSWGQAGVLWGKNTVTVYIRPSRYTKEFIDSNGFFTVSFFDDAQRSALNICGSKSGRDIDKTSIEGISAAYDGELVYFNEAKLVLACKKLYTGELNEAGFLEKAPVTDFYPKKDFHTFYVGEIVKALRRGGKDEY